MIFVTVGTNHARFDRLVSPFLDWDGDEELVVQHGPSPLRPPGARCHEFMSFGEMAATAEAARVVVTHAGVGSVLLALAHGKRPVVVARLHRFGEAVDDHQLAFATRLAEAGIVTLVDLVRDGARALMDALDLPASPRDTEISMPNLSVDVQRYVRSVVAH